MDSIDDRESVDSICVTVYMHNIQLSRPSKSPWRALGLEHLEDVQEYVEAVGCSVEPWGLAPGQRRWPIFQVVWTWNPTSSIMSFPFRKQEHLVFPQKIHMFNCLVFCPSRLKRHASQDDMQKLQSEQNFLDAELQDPGEDSGKTNSENRMVQVTRAR